MKFIRLTTEQGQLTTASLGFEASRDETPKESQAVILLCAGCLSCIDLFPASSSRSLTWKKRGSGTWHVSRCTEGTGRSILKQVLLVLEMLSVQFLRFQKKSL